jgi:hypothetical protein
MLLHITCEGNNQIGQKANQVEGSCGANNSDFSNTPHSARLLHTHSILHALNPAAHTPTCLPLTTQLVQLQEALHSNDHAERFATAWLCPDSPTQEHVTLLLLSVVCSLTGKTIFVASQSRSISRHTADTLHLCLKASHPCRPIKPQHPICIGRLLTSSPL